MWTTCAIAHLTEHDRRCHCESHQSADMLQWDDERLLACAYGKLSMTGDMTAIQQTTPLSSSQTGAYAQVTSLTPPSLPQEHLKALQQSGVDATWVPDSVEHSSLYEDNIVKLTGGSWVWRILPLQARLYSSRGCFAGA